MQEDIIIERRFCMLSLCVFKFLGCEVVGEIKRHSAMLLAFVFCVCCLAVRWLRKRTP